MLMVMVFRVKVLKMIQVAVLMLPEYQKQPRIIR
jgi:hypothetical protein